MWGYWNGHEQAGDAGADGAEDENVVCANVGEGVCGDEAGAEADDAGGDEVEGCLDYAEAEVVLEAEEERANLGKGK